MQKEKRRPHKISIDYVVKAPSNRLQKCQLLAFSTPKHIQNYIVAQNDDKIHFIFLCFSFIKYNKWKDYFKDNNYTVN